MVSKIIGKNFRYIKSGMNTKNVTKQTHAGINSDNPSTSVELWKSREP